MSRRLFAAGLVAAALISGAGSAAGISATGAVQVTNDPAPWFTSERPSSTIEPLCQRSTRAMLPAGPTASVLDVLGASAADRWVSFEWEKRWHPEIEEPEVALRRAEQHFTDAIAIAAQAITGRAFQRGSLSIGSFDTRRATLDLNQPLLDRKLAARLNLVYNDTQSFREWAFQKQMRAHFTTTYRLTEQTRIRAEFEKGVGRKLDLVLPFDAKTVAAATNFGQPVAAGKGAVIVWAPFTSTSIVR